MTSYAKIQWIKEYTYYGEVADNAASGKGLVVPSDRDRIDEAGLFRVTKLTGVFDGRLVKDAVFEFERQGFQYTFAGEMDGLCLKKGSLTCKTGKSWNFNGTFNGMKLNVGVLGHPVLADTLNVSSLDIEYYELSGGPTLVQILKKMGEDAVVKLPKCVYTKTHVVCYVLNYIYDGEYCINGDAVELTGKAKKIYVESGIVIDGKFRNGEFVSGHLSAGTVKIPINGHDDHIVIAPEVFA